MNVTAQNHDDVSALLTVTIQKSDYKDNVEKQLLNSINTLIETFNNYLIGDKRLIVNTNEIYVEIDGYPRTIDVLSSGERHIFTFLSLIVIACRDRDILIIDEPEISLNIK